MSTSYARTKFKFYHGKLIRSYNTTTWHQLLGLVCIVDSSTFHWPLNSPIVVRKGLWFIVDLIWSKQDEEPSAGEKNKATIWTQGLDQNTPDRDRQTDRQRERESTNQILVPVIEKLSSWIYMSLSKIKIQGTWVSRYFLDSYFDLTAWSVNIRCQIKKHFLARFTGLEVTVIVKNMNKTWDQHLSSPSAQQ